MSRSRKLARSSEWPRGGLFVMTPRKKKIYLKVRTWIHHIIENHPELRNFRDEVLMTLKSPEAIHKDLNALIAYRFSPRMGKFIIVVYYCKKQVGKIITSYTEIRNPYRQVEGLPRIWP